MSSISLISGGTAEPGMAAADSDAQKVPILARLQHAMPAGSSAVNSAGDAGDHR